MGITFRLALGLLIAVFTVHLLKLVKKGKLQLKYSLLWLFLCFLAGLCDLFPGIVFGVSNFIGFITPSNFIYLVAIAILLSICFSLSLAVSRYSVAVRNLTQKLALIEKQLKESPKPR